MKNIGNLALVAVLLVGLGCSCQRLGDLTRKKGTPPPERPSASPSTSPSSTPSTSSTYGLTMAKYKQLKTNMPRADVERILGGPGEEVSSSTGGGMTFSVYKWSGPDYTSIILSFKNDRIMSMSQVGLK